MTAAITIHDDALIQSLQQVLPEGPPFSADQLAALDALAVRYVSDLTPLTHCHNLLVLDVIGSDVRTWPLADLPKLDSLGLPYSHYCNLKPLLAYPKLRKLNLRATFVEDIAPLFEIPKLRAVTLNGCPLSDESYHELVPKLREHVPAQSKRPPKVHVSAPSYWQLTRDLHAHGLQACYTANPDKVHAPGLSYSAMPDLNNVRLSADALREALAAVEYGDLEGFMKRCKALAA